MQIPIVVVTFVAFFVVVVVFLFFVSARVAVFRAVRAVCLTRWV